MNTGFVSKTLGRNSSAIRLRLQGADGEHVALDVEKLPRNVYDVTSMLRLETAPRSIWRDVAAAYMRSGRTTAASAVLEQGSADDVDNMLGDGTGDSCSRTDLLAALAGSYVLQADSPRISPTERLDLLRKAADVFSRADLIDADQPAVWTAKGAAEIAASRTHDAKTWFENAYQNGWVPATLGLASVLLNGSIKMSPDPLRASSLLISALHLAPCPAGTWTGLGYALFNAGNVKMARNVLRRAVKATSMSAASERLEALYALARVESADASQQSVENAITSLREAYVFCGGHSEARILTLLAEIYFLAGKSSAAEKYAERAVGCADKLSGPASGPLFAHIKRTICCLAWFELARARHEQGQLDQAVEGYEQVLRLAEEAESSTSDASVAVNPGVYLRLGLLKLSSTRKEDLDVAEQCLNKVLASFDERCAVALRGLGILIGRRELDKIPFSIARDGEQVQRAKDLLKRGLAAQDGLDDVVAMLVYAALAEETEPVVALSMCERVIAVLEKRQGKVPAEVYSNTIALLARVGRVSEAWALAEEKLSKDFTDSSLVLMYNSARLAEMGASYDEARAQYEAMLARDPEFHAARIRLACMAAWRDGDFSVAETMLDRVRGSKSRHSIVAAGFLNKLYGDTKNPKAQQALLESFGGDSEYMSLAFAQFMYSHLDGVGSSDRRHRFLIEYIGVPLQQILKRNKRNVYAANGIGVFFAENNMMAEARDAFSAAGRGQEIARSSRVNLAHSTIALAKSAVRARNESATLGIRYTTAQVPTARGLCEQAEKLYSDAYDMSRGDEEQGKSTLLERLELLLYRANAKYEIGSYRCAAVLLQKILHFCPDSCTTWFNLGQMLRECAGERVLHDNKICKEMEKAKSELEACRAAFAKAAHLDRGSVDRITRTRLDRKFLDHHTRFIQQALRTHEVQLLNARTEAEDRERLREKQREHIEAQRELKNREEVQKLEREKARQLELEQAAAAAAAKLRMTEEQARRDLEEKELERNRKKDFEDDDIIYEDGAREEPDSDGQDHISKRKRGRKRERAKMEKPVKRRRARRESSSHYSESSSDEYNENDVSNLAEDLGNNVARQVDQNVSGGEEQDEDDGVTRTRARKRFAVAPDSDNESS